MVPTVGKTTSVKERRKQQRTTMDDDSAIWERVNSSRDLAMSTQAALLVHQTACDQRQKDIIRRLEEIEGMLRKVNWGVLAGLLSILVTVVVAMILNQMNP